jgi:predicted RNase H-like HicB family nuclease
MYRLGWPCATFFAKMGVPLLIKVEIIRDTEADVYVATSPDLKGLVVEAETLDELEKEVWELVPELLTLVQNLKSIFLISEAVIYFCNINLGVYK